MSMQIQVPLKLMPKTMKGKTYFEIYGFNYDMIYNPTQFIFSTLNRINKAGYNWSWLDSFPVILPFCRDATLKLNNGPIE